MDIIRIRLVEAEGMKFVWKKEWKNKNMESPAEGERMGSLSCEEEI